MSILKDDITPILIVATATSVIIAWVLRDFSFIINVNIMFFAIIEALSTYLQVIDSRKQRRFQHIQTELEKCYGPLSIILNKPEYDMGGVHHGNGLEPAINFQYREKMKIDSIFYSYPHLIAEDLLQYWTTWIRDELQSTTGSVDIIVRFVKRVSEEYDARVVEYRQLVGKSTSASVAEDET